MHFSARHCDIHKRTGVKAHMENISETNDLYGRAAGTGLWERGGSQENTSRTWNMDVSISQAKWSGNEYMILEGACL